VKKIREVEITFDKYADKYDEWYIKHREVFINELKVLKSLKLKGRGLDIGVGTGILSSKINIEVGIDPSVKMIKIAKKRMEVIRAIGEKLPFKSSTFHYVLMIATLCFLENPIQTLKEAWRVLKENGLIVTCIIPKNSKWGMEYEKKKHEGHKIYRHANFRSIKEVNELLRKAGFSIIEYKSTLSYGPHEKAKIENPSEDIRDKGFICIKAKKQYSQ